MERRMKGKGWTGLLAALIVAGFLCYPAPAATARLLVFAAASLKNAIDEIAQDYRNQGKGEIVVSYGASPALARQIEAGAPADIFISADLDWMDYLAGKQLIKPATRSNLLSNAIVLIAPTGSTLSLAIGPNFPLAESLGNGRLAMADPASVPAGKYGKASLETLGVWASVAAKVAPAENVRAALLLVARGETPLGIVYRTDAAAEPGVRVVGTFPEESHPPIVYPVAVTASSSDPAAADFVAYLRSPPAKAAFTKQGFTVLP
jgi:molybdate transport system substrate-binding protein